MNFTILTFIAHYLPGFKSGGPVRTIANMVDHLGGAFDFRIVTRDRDFLDNEAYPGLQADTWHKMDCALVYYASPQALSLGRIARLIRHTPHDILYLNSFFNLRFTILPLFARKLGLFVRRPTVLAPRGEFSQGALALKEFKKRVFIDTSKITGLYSNLHWHASSTHEKQDIVRTMGAGVAKDISIAPNLPQKQAQPLINGHYPRKQDEPLRIVFLSRISPKKNLDFTLKVLAEVKVHVIFDIYGMVDAKGYWDQCKNLIKKLPGNIKVSYKGVIDHGDVAEVLAAYDLFFLPTRGENYGHAIYETLAAGTPALISDQTPWQDLDAKRVGWARPLNDIKPFAKIIEEQAVADAAKLSSQRKRATEYALFLAKNGDAINQNIDLFKRVFQK